MVKKRNVFFPAFFLCAALVCAQENRPPGTEPPHTAPPDKALPPAADSTGLFDLLQNRFGGITITAYRGTEKTVSIPETIGGLPVTIIGSKAFYRRDLDSVIIPATVLHIEALAFAENRLTSLELSGCLSIGYEAFAGNRLDVLVLSEKLVSIGQRAFMNNRLSTVTLPPRISTIGKDAFAGNSLSAITLGPNRNIFASQGFELSFVNYYTGTGRRAGIYVKDESIWSLQSDPAE